MICHFRLLFVAFTISLGRVVEAAVPSFSPQTETSARSVGADSQGGNGATGSNDLPIQPQLTPALAIAGVVLIFTGLAYLLIGIKNKRLHIFFSAGYLTILAVTVLIVYVVSPPISNAIQGAYLVAVVIPGLVFGSAALLITDITEGLGCLLGGFCITMWLFVMRPGGLIHGQAAKIIFISVLTIAAFTLSFSRWTKEYALIILTSFAGATAAIMGVDCFSRAGLKEFWLYVWDLNGKLFPPTISTYPITRGMRAEVALIFVIFVGGVISQSKAWNGIKDRRKYQAAILLENERQREQMDEDLRRRLEEGNHRERTHWEAAYGDRQNQRRLVSTIERNLTGSPKTSTSLVGTKELGPNTETIEMISLDPSRRGAQDVVYWRAAEGNQNAIANDRITNDESNCQDQLRGVGSLTECLPRSLSGAPAITPPIKTLERKPISSISDGKSKANEMRPCSSTIISPSPLPSTHWRGERGPQDPIIATPAAEFRSSRSPSKLPGRLEVNGRCTKSVKADLEFDEAFLPPKIDLSRTSSLAVTVDKFYDNRGIDSQRSDDQKPVEQAVNIELDEFRHEPISETEPERIEELGNILKPQTEKPDWSQPHPINIVGVDNSQQNSVLTDNSEDTDRLGLRRGGTPRRQKSRSTIRSNKRDSTSLKEWLGKSRTRANSDKVQRESLTVNTIAQLPSQSSRSVTAYRTDEWAKHLSAAEKPDVDLLTRGSNSDDDETKQDQEPTVSYMASEPERTGKGKKVLQALPQDSLVSLQTGPEEAKISRSSSNDSRESAPDSQKFPSQALVLTRGPAKPHLRSSSSPFPSQALINRGIRNSSLQVFDQSLVDSPIDECSETVYPSQSASIRNNYSFPSVWSASPASSTLSTNTAHHPHHGCNFDFNPQEDDDNMSLSERRSIIQATRQLRLHHRAASHELQVPRLSSTNPYFDSHQPQQQSRGYRPERRESMMAAWRESLRWDHAAGQGLEATGELFQGQRVERQRRSLEQVGMSRESGEEKAVRGGQLEELHREAMRRLQARADTGG